MRKGQAIAKALKQLGDVRDWLSATAKSLPKAPARMRVMKDSAAHHAGVLGEVAVTLQNCDPTHNGWTNYETWAVKLWLDNDQSTYQYWQRAAAAAKRSAPTDTRCTGRRPVWDVETCAKITLADRLKDEIAAPVGIKGMWADLLNGALSEVDWYAIAEAFLEE